MAAGSAGYLDASRWPLMRVWIALLAMSALMVPSVTAHGALELNEFDTYAISDFEGQEDSFPWEGFEIWDIYAGDGYLAAEDSHGVYFKGNFAGDGTLRPSGSQEWTLRFNFDVAGESFERTIVHDGVDVTSDFEMLEWQIADGNVFQVNAWVPVNESEGAAIENLFVLSSVDGDPRDIAPGGIYSPETGEEVPVAAPESGVFPAMGEGRIVETVPLTGSEKFLDVALEQEGTAFTFTVTNPLLDQGQHFSARAVASNWTVAGIPAPTSIDGGGSTEFTLTLVAPADGLVEPLQVDLLSDIGGRESWFIYVDETGVRAVDNADQATPYTMVAEQEAPGFPVLLLLAALFLARRR